jgi:trimethylamine---corrinoid protein Co-methyltransferase
MAGATAPITLAGTLLSGIAEVLSGLVLVQNYRKGSPVIFGGVFTTLDMKDMIFTYGGPELQLMNAAIAQLAQFYGIPSFGTAGATDAHEVDAQAAFEAGNSILLNALSGSNLVHDVGWMSSAQATSNELLILGDEMIAYAKRFLSGINTDLIERSVEELSAVGPGGNFIERDLTLELFRKEVWYSSVLRRTPQKSWMSSDKRSLKERLAGRAADIIAKHKPPAIPEGRLSEIGKLIAAYEKELAG